MSTRGIEVERQGSVTRVWLSRPERRNALDTGTLEALEATFRGLQEDFDTRVVVLGGRGPSFCAGADRKSPPGAERMAGASGAGPRERRYAAQLGRRAVAALADLEAVSIARIQGHAVGGGVALALACDFRLAARDARLRIPEVDLGIPLAWGATPLLVREVGPLRARELILLCEELDAERALAWGLLNRVVDARDLDAAVDDWAARLAAKPELAVHMTKTQLRGLARSGPLGDLAEADGDLLFAASATATARKSFGAG